MAIRVQRLLDKKRVKNRAVTEMTAVYLQTAKSKPRPRPVVRSPTTPASSGEGDSSSESSEVSGVSGESLLEGDGVAEAIGTLRSLQAKGDGESLWSPGVVCRLFGTPELPHKCFPEAAISAAPKASAPMVGAASSDAAMVPPTPDSPASLPSVIFRPGRLIEKTLIETTPMIRAEDGSLVPAPPSIPPRHYLPPPPTAPVQSRGQTLAEREFVLPKPMQGGASSSDAPLGASSSEAPVGVSSSAVPSAAQFEDYESVVEAARAAIESASKEL